MTPLRVAVLDDHAARSAGVRSIVEAAPDLQSVGDAAGGPELWSKVRAARPEVLRVDLRDSGRDGRALAALRSQGTDARGWSTRGADGRGKLFDVPAGAGPDVLAGAAR